MTDGQFSVYFVLGEQSGDDLAADLYPVLKDRLETSGEAIATPEQ